MSRLLRILLQSLQHHGRITQHVGLTARECRLAQRPIHTSQRLLCSDSSGPWDPRVRGRRKNDSDDPATTTRPQTSPPSPVQSPYLHPEFTDTGTINEFTSVSTQTDDDTEYGRDDLRVMERGTVEKRKYGGDRVTVGGGRSVDKSEYGRNFAQSLERDDGREYDLDSATSVRQRTVESRGYGRDGLRERGTFDEREYGRDYLTSVERSDEKREYNRDFNTSVPQERDFDRHTLTSTNQGTELGPVERREFNREFNISLQEDSVDEREYDRDSSTPTNRGTDLRPIDRQVYNGDSVAAIERGRNDLDIPEPKEDYLLPSQKEKRKSELLRERIRECSDVEEVFALHRKHRAAMGINHILLVLDVLAGLVSERIETAEAIRNRNEFREVGQHLYEVTRRMLADDVTAALKSLCRLKVPADSKLVQVVLQMLRHQINDLDLKTLVFVEFLLRKLSPRTSLSDALLTAFPLLLDTKLSSRGQLTDVTILELSKLLSMGSSGVNSKSRQGGKLVNELWKRHSEIQEAPLSRSVAWSLLDLTNTRHKRIQLHQDQRKDRDSLLNYCLEVLAQDLHSLSHKELESFLSRLSNAYKNRDHDSYNQLFLHEVAQHTLKQQHLNVKQVAFILDKLFLMRFQSDSLCQHLVSLGVSCPGEVRDANLPLISVLESLSSCTQPMPHLHHFLNTIMTAWDDTINEENMHHKPVLRIALNLLSLQYYHPKLMSLITNPDTLSMYISQFPHHHRNHLRLLEVTQAIQTLPTPPPEATTTPDAFLAPARRQLMEKPPTRSSLNVMLEKVVEEGCIVSGVVTEQDVYIDHLLVLNQSGRPVQMSSPVQSEQNVRIESLDIPPDYTRLAIMDVGSGRSLRPTHQLHGITRLQRRVLEHQGFRVMPFLQAAFYSVQQDEKLLYVARELMKAGVVLDDTAPQIVTMTHDTHHHHHHQPRVVS
ncbi:hypothetical protein Pmani_002514 [Petrolisthes manimaculis]|uniref:RAP domain-containing protein n=1 Tax=Petrolisthes manimaculis TaxID=1843537 RepID=A0AAE1QID6_9EUCA|nr:hypothetical protein Pmani_002514 [Petrolisthes manimaculis]